MRPNVPSIFEAAIAEAIYTVAKITGDLPRFRTYRSIDADARWSVLKDREMPCILITAGTPEEDNQGERQVAVSVSMMTNAADDPDRKHIAHIEAEMQGVMDDLYAQYRGSTGEARTAFESRIATELQAHSLSLHIGGVTFGAGGTPSIEEGMNIVTVEVIVHYSRSDYP